MLVERLSHRMWMSGAGATIAILVLWSPQIAIAQGRYISDHIDTGEKKALRIRDIANRPCIEMHGVVRSHLGSPSVVDQDIIAENNCVKPIKIKACFVDQPRCVEFSLHSREKKEIILGATTVSDNAAFFKFDFTEHEGF